MPRVQRSWKKTVSLGAAGTLVAGALVALSGATYADNTAAETTISEIQGEHHRSDLLDEQVTTTGVTTAVSESGYWIQDPDGDDDPRTSDGIYVFTTPDGTKPEVGQTVTVHGEVAEYRPGSADGPNLAITELTNASFEVADEQLAAPEPVRIGADGRQAPPQLVDAAADESGQAEPTDIEDPSTEFDPSRDAADFYESMEGMLVELRSPEVVGPTNSYGEITVVPADAATEKRTPNGGVRYGSYETPNTERVTVDAAVFDGSMPDANVGDTLAGSVSGPLHYDFGNYRVSPATAPEVADGGLRREEVPAAAEKELSVGTFNVENLDPGDPQSTFDRLGRTIVTNLAAPDVLTLEEVQDNTGPECDGSGQCDPDGVTDADETLTKLVNAISDNGGPEYEWRQISPEYDADGGQPSGNIRNVLLFRSDRGLEFVDRPGGDATTATEVVGQDGSPRLSASPGRIDPQHEAWQDSRKPLVGEFEWQGRTVFVIANHFASKGGDDPLFGRVQPPQRDSEQQRHQQAEVVHDFVRRILDVDPDAHVVVAGDINDFEFSRTTEILRGEDTLVDLPAEHTPAADRYSYVYQGNSQILDHILLSPATHETLQSYDLVRVNVEFADQVSDHDPQLARLILE